VELLPTLDAGRAGVELGRYRLLPVPKAFLTLANGCFAGSLPAWGPGIFDAMGGHRSVV